MVTGDTPLHVAVSQNSAEKLVLLFKYNVNPFVRNFKGKTAKMTIPKNKMLTKMLICYEQHYLKKIKLIPTTIMTEQSLLQENMKNIILRDQL